MLKNFLCTSLLLFSFATIAEGKSLTIYTTNDLHGRLKPFEYHGTKDVGGAARRATLLKANPNALILDAGDFAQGTLYFKIFPNNVNLEVLKKSNYSALTLGNHEFDKGTEYIKKSASSTNLPIISSNIKFKDKELNKKIKKNFIKNINGINVAIIGVVDKSLKAQSSTNPATYQIYDEIKTIKKQVKKVDKKSDLIIILSHSGIEKDKEIAKKVKNIDLIIGGHSHTMLKEPLEITNQTGEKVLISQNGEFGTVLGQWDLEIEDDKIKSWKFKQIEINNKIQPDKEVENFIEKYDAPINDFSKDFVGSSLTPIDARRQIVECNLTTAGGLFHQAVKDKYPEVEITMNTSGGYRYGGILPVNMTKRDIAELFPFDSYLVILEVKGSDILSILETSSRILPKPEGFFLQTTGISYTVNTKNQSQVLDAKLTKILKKGNRVSDVMINGEPLNPDKHYTLATDTFLYYGGEGYIQLKKYKHVKHTYYFLDKILVEYLKKNSPVEVILKDKIILK